MGPFFKIREKLREVVLARRDFSRDEASARCGRCAHILPDETLTFCPRCGIPFSKVPPTGTYSTLADHAHVLLLKRYRLRLTLTTASVFAAFWLLLASFSFLQTESLLAKLKPVRALDVYLVEDPAYPHIDVQTQVESVAVAIQSFEAHFGIRIGEVSLHRDRLPPIITEKFPGLWSNPQRSSLSYWESKVFPNLNPEWDEVSSEPLPIVFTNIPIVNDLGGETSLETAHLNPWGLISGLGHPSLSIISTYRMLREEKRLFGKVIDANDSERRRLEARFMGEYVFAHELGHALLALPDFVQRNRISSQVGFRGPASVDSDEPDYAKCLMHTDQGGGYHAWQAIRSRPIQSVYLNPCPEYQSVITAFKIRNQALQALRKGDHAKAETLYNQALQAYDPPAKTWLRSQWEQEDALFMSVIKRWWSGIFVIQSKT
ncbi:MAG: hypothetical protein ABIR96_12135 [Bdellovibrionota bacterium]